MTATNDNIAETLVDPAAWIATLDPSRRAQEGARLLALFSSASGTPARMCGSAIVGFGTYHYRYESGRTGESMRIGFSPRAGKHVLYLNVDGAGEDDHAPLLARLGKHKTNGGCIYINKLADIDMDVLGALVRQAWARMERLYPA